MRGFASKLAALLTLVFLPVIALIAFSLISYGVSLLCYPAGWISGGILLSLAVIDARR